MTLEEPLRFKRCDMDIGELRSLLRYSDGTVEIRENATWEIVRKIGGPRGEWIGSSGGYMAIYDRECPGQLHIYRPYTGTDIVIDTGEWLR